MSSTVMAWPERRVEESLPRGSITIFYLCLEEHRGLPNMMNFAGMERVRIVTGPDQRNAAIVITAAELHPDCLVLNYISQVEQQELQRGLVDGKAKRFDVTDNLGTEYKLVGGSGGGEGDLLRRMDLKFSPAVPSNATSLEVTMGIGTVVFAL